MKSQRSTRWFTNSQTHKEVEGIPAFQKLNNNIITRNKKNIITCTTISRIKKEGYEIHCPTSNNYLHTTTLRPDKEQSCLPR